MFKQIFGEDQDAIKPFCLLAPFYNAGLLQAFKIPRLKQGWLYACGHNTELTFIHTRMGPAYLGDAVLHLEKTPVRNLVLLGACGAVSIKPGMELGAIIIPSGSYAMDSFSSLLAQDMSRVSVHKSDEGLSETLWDQNSGPGQRVAAAASFASFYLETHYQDYLLQQGIDIVDMETAALFQAAALTRKKAAAILYVSDILPVSHPFRPWSREEAQVINTASLKAAETVMRAARQINVSKS
ncbi:MAG TPA: hypothetical protein PLT76_05520 [Candidatus Omnitrophota bacterium]|nr:hypothetical protein [Candidatus Omnitrophota bacterium]HPB68263.1 hypothetical protein [Candidatus Omnitrophota bacterium]HQO58162.1 hypothetical protein [Candidatus Omnitrophota bacterium]HQP11845.1 hypothetical protein [Candidatus Omnitrophota bacterium]